MTKMRPRALFFGSPDFAVPCLSALLEIADVRLVITQPDRPAGRGLSLRMPAVKVRAQEAGIEVIQPKKVRTKEFRDRLAAEEADVAVVVAYGRILTQEVLDVPKHGCVNVHASLLPKWRGAAPIQWSIVNGDRESGVCLMRMDAGMDTGPVISSDRTPIGAEETAGELFARLSSMGAALLTRDLPRYLAGELKPVDQDHAQATMAPLLKKEDGLIDWDKGAQAVHDHCRGLSPWPLAFTYIDGKRLRVHRSVVETREGSWGAPGEIVRMSKHGVDVSCGSGLLRIVELQLDGKKRLHVRDFMGGVNWSAGMRFTSQTA